MYFIHGSLWYRVEFSQSSQAGSRIKLSQNSHGRSRMEASQNIQLAREGGSNFGLRKRSRLLFIDY